MLELSEEPWVWIARDVSPDYHDEMASAFRSAGFAPRKLHTARSIASQTAMVAGGNGISIIPRSAAANLPPGVGSREIVDGGRTVTLAVSTREAPGPHEAFLERIIQHVIHSNAAGAIPSVATSERPAAEPAAHLKVGSGQND